MATYGPKNQEALGRGWPKSSLSPNGSAVPAEPPMSPSGKSYYTKGDDPREGKASMRDKRSAYAKAR